MSTGLPADTRKAHRRLTDMLVRDAAGPGNLQHGGVRRRKPAWVSRGTVIASALLHRAEWAMLMIVGLEIR